MTRIAGSVALIGDVRQHFRAMEALVKGKNEHAIAMQRAGQKVIRKKYGADFWRKIRRGEKPSQLCEQSRAAEPVVAA